jgi:hypothetical protein
MMRTHNQNFLQPLWWLLTAILLLVSTWTYADDTLCARVKIEIKQELTLERQAFDAEMKINNGLDTMALTDVDVNLTFVDDAGVTVKATSDSNDTTAQFYVNIDTMENISNVNGTGSVAPSTTADIHWLIIPAPGSGGTSPAGKMYLIGATLNYKLGGEAKSVTVAPDSIYVKPMPLLTLDYFLTQEVIADDPLTTAIEPAEPFTLGVRVKNTGAADAHTLKIDSAQPTITDNTQGLLINFALIGSYVDDQPVSNTLLVDFGDIVAGKSRAGRWVMQTSLAGKFSAFTAQFTHADELGGTLTSLIQAVNTHFLVHDVKVDLAGRDNVRDFLAADGDTLRVYETDMLDTVVTDTSASSVLSSAVNAQGQAVYHLTAPAMSGFMYVRKPDPYTGTRSLGQVSRSDGKYMLAENVWLSKSKNADKQWDYWINFFDINSTGVYDVPYAGATTAAQPPVIQAIAAQSIKEGQHVGFLVQASSPDHKLVSLSASPLPVGATFVTESSTTDLTTSVFDWTPAKGQAGSYFIAYVASDGTLSTTLSATITVVADTPPPGPATPALVAPAVGVDVTTLKPAMVVQTSTSEQDPTKSVVFELYRDAAMQQLVETKTVNKGVTTAAAGTTSYTPTADLLDNTYYWWRARASDGATLYSEWVNGNFRVNLYNDPPNSFKLISPIANIEVAVLQPQLMLTNTSDIDGDAIAYGFELYSDAALQSLIVSVGGLAPGADGTTQWQDTVPLTNHVTYYWRATATDSHGAVTDSQPDSFIVNTGNTAPTAPLLIQPVNAAVVTTSTADLVVTNSSDAESDPVSYVYDMDSDPNFASANRQKSASIPAGSDGYTHWTVTGLQENLHYYWRVTASDSRATTLSATSTFFKNAVNEAPSVPVVKNPGNGAWVASLKPVFEVNPSVDPEGDAISYRFEVYNDSALAHLVVNGVVSGTTSWIPPVSLTDKTTYYWRVRAEDALGLASAWSPTTVLYISTGTYVTPSIVMTTPSSIVTPVDNGSGKKVVNLAWTGTAPNLEASTTLYYDLSSTAYSGSKLAEGFTQPAGIQSGQYQWDVTTLAVGTYYFYAEIRDPLGMGHGYAPGALVVPAPVPTGHVDLIVPTALTTDSNGGSSSFTVKLSNAPTANVTLPVTSSNTALGVVSPNQLVFTPQNWATQQTVKVTGVVGSTGAKTQTYQVTVGKAVSLDPQYINVSGGSLTVTHTIVKSGRK